MFESQYSPPSTTSCPPKPGILIKQIIPFFPIIWLFTFPVPCHPISLAPILARNAFAKSYTPLILACILHLFPFAPTNIFFKFGFEETIIKQITKPVSICGELGIETLSMSPKTIPALKEFIRNI